MWGWVLGGIVVIALIGGAISTHYEDKLWEEFLRKLWNRITGGGRSKQLEPGKQGSKVGLTNSVNTKSIPPT